MRHLFAVQASFGHLLPAMRLARLMLERDHEATFVMSDHYAALLGLHGLTHVRVSNQGLPFLATQDWYAPETVAAQVRVLNELADQLKPDVIVTGPLCLGPLIVAEQRALPTVVIGYGEYLYPGVADMDATRWWRLRTLTEFYNGARRALGMAPVAVDPLRSPLLGSLYLLRGVPRFTSPARLPPQVRHVGGLYWEPSVSSSQVERFVKRSRERGRRLVYLQLGRLFNKGWVWKRTLEVLDEVGVDCIADVSRADYLEGSLVPEGVLACPFVSVGAVPSADAVVCSAHTAAVLGAVTHLKPLLCVPGSADNDEAARRVVACGMGASLDYREELTAEAVASFFSQAARGDFLPGLTTLREELEAFRAAEPELGDMAQGLLPVEPPLEGGASPGAAARA